MQPAFQPFWQLVWLNWIDRHLRLFWNLLILANVAGKVQLSVKHKTLSPNAKGSLRPYHLHLRLIMIL